MTKRRTGKIKRRRPTRQPKIRFILFCEGKNTEPAYFSAIGRVWNDALVSIESRDGIGVPIKIAREAVAFARSEGLAQGGRRPRNRFEKRDEVWAVFDRDNHQKYEEAVRLCETNGIRVARSNPCFEVWLILHEQDYNRPDDSKKAQRVLEQLRPEYDRAGTKVPDCDEIVARVRDAEERAQVLLLRRQDEMQPHGRPSTTVGNLTKAIREAAERAGGRKVRDC